MRAKIRRRNVGLGVIATAIGVSPAAPAGAEILAAPYSTPFGITLVDVTAGLTGGGGGGGGDQLLWRRLGDIDGKPLYTFNADGTTGKSTCVAECAKEFPPYLAAKGAVTFGAWSIVGREDGTKQWAYENRPLYRYSGEDPVFKKTRGNQSNANASDAQAKAKRDAMDPGSKAYAPKDGWRLAALLTDGIPTPPEFGLKSIATANGYAFTLAATGRVLYVFGTAPEHIVEWTPAYAAALAKEVGDFSIVMREDGKRQWAYKRQPLYTYNNDYAPDDIGGLLAQKDAQVAFVYRNYMPASMTIEILPLRGPILVTTQGKTVYVQTRNRNQYGGRENRGGFRFNYLEAKAVGARGCVNECLKTWQPVVAPTRAQASGFWEIYTREDGTRQWAYKGAALYTHAADKKIGDTKGNNIHEVVYGDGANEDLVKLAGGDAKGASGAGFYWHVVPFFD